MKMHRLSLGLTMLLSVSIFFACSSEDTEPQQTQISNPSPTVPDDANAVLAAIKSRSTSPNTVPGMPDMLIDIASANFFSANLGGKRVSVGEVKLNGNELNNAGDSYVNPLTTISLAINSGQGNDWEIAGGNGFEAFSHSTTKKTPGAVRLTGIADEIALGGELKLSIESIPIYADNILWVVSDGKNIATKEVKSTSVTFSAADLTGIKATSTGLIQVAAYNYEFKSISGKKVYFINQTVDTKMPKLTK